METKTINIKVLEQVATLGSNKVVDAVVDRLVTAEIAKRANILADAVALADTITREIKRAAKPDQVFINAAGEKTETFSKNAFENKKKTEDKLAQLDKLVVQATEKAEWDNLNQFVSSAKKSNENKEGGSAKDEPATNKE